MKLIWTDDQNNQLIEMINNEQSLRSVARFFAISNGALRNQIARLKQAGLLPAELKKCSRFWKTEEDDLIRKHASKHTLEETTAILNQAGFNRSKHAVWHRAATLKIPKPRFGATHVTDQNGGKKRVKYWRRKDDIKLIHLAERRSIALVAKRLGRSYSATRSRAEKLGVKWGRSGTRISDLAKEFDLSFGTIWRLVTLLFQETMTAQIRGHNAGCRKYLLNDKQADQIRRVIAGKIKYGKLRANEILYF